MAPAYQDLKQRFPEVYRFDDRDLAGIVLTLDGMDRSREAIAFGDLLLQEFPSTRFLELAHLTLGSSHRKLGETQLALGHYRKALELNPKSETAKKGIEVLEAGS